MSSFTEPLIYQNTGRWLKNSPIYVVQKPFRYYVGKPDSSVWVDVPEGLETDLASTPNVVWSLFPSNGVYDQMAVLHDYLYQEGLVSRILCDVIFYEAMGVPLKGQPVIPEWRRWSMYRAVRLFGRGAYGFWRQQELNHPKVPHPPIGGYDPLSSI